VHICDENLVWKREHLGMTTYFTRHGSSQHSFSCKAEMISICTKRKREDVDYDSDDDEPSFGKQILPVANLPMDFDCEPQDGMEYLFTVRWVLRHLWL